MSETKRQIEWEIDQVRSLHWMNPIKNNKDHTWSNAEPVAMSLLRQNMTFKDAYHSYEKRRSTTTETLSEEGENDLDIKFNKALSKVCSRLSEVYIGAERRPSQVELNRWLKACNLHVPAVIARLKHTRAFKKKHGMTNRLLINFNIT